MMKLFTLDTVLLLFFFHFVQKSAGIKRCRCLADNKDCWPSIDQWQTFNASINGRLRIPRSSATPCTAAEFNDRLCNETFQNWANSAWRSDQLGAMQYFNWENASCSIFIPNSVCKQGSIPVLAVDAIWPEHVMSTLELVRKYDLRLTIKTTGHDLLGRSTAYGSLLLWLHHMKNMTMVPTYQTCNRTTISNAVRVDAGVQWSEVYTMLKDYGLVVLGGTSASVAVAGGFMQAGGHSPLSRWAGMPTDQVLEYDVITVDGRRLTASPCQESDLYWALSGGGPGSYAIVISIVLRTFPSPVMVGSLQTIQAPNASRYNQLIREFFRMLPSFADRGLSGYFTMQDTKLSITLIWPNGNLTALNETMLSFYENNMDLVYEQSVVAALPTFHDFFLYVLVGRDPTGYNGMVGSRLLPESIVRNRIDSISDLFIEMNGESQRGSQLVISMVGGGKSSDFSMINNSVNPLWRKSLLHVFYAQGWSDDTSQTVQNQIADEVDRKTRLLDTLSSETLFGCYMNEANPNEPLWKQRFFGSLSRYNQLKQIKKQYDPNSILICKNCVGSDDWSADLNCQKRNIAIKTVPYLGLSIIALVGVSLQN